MRKPQRDEVTCLNRQRSDSNPAWSHTKVLAFSLLGDISPELNHQKIPSIYPSLLLTQVRQKGKKPSEGLVLVQLLKSFPSILHEFKSSKSLLGINSVSWPCLCPVLHSLSRENVHAPCWLLLGVSLLLTRGLPSTPS